VKLLKRVPDSMRVVAAGLLIFIAVLAVVNILGEDGFERTPPWVSGGAIGLFMIGLCVVATRFLNRGGDPFGRRTEEEQVAELERLNLLQTTSFRANRAFGVGEFEDEGLHYFLELEDGRVLFLSGQYLYDYEPIDDDPELNRARAFPCTDFIVRRHRHDGYVVDIACQGKLLEPEVVTPPFGRKDWKDGRVPEDGAILEDVTYDELKRQRLA
jgi:hypothetical protein